jgi:hypothetical protein
MSGARRLLQELACSDRRVRELAALAGQPQNLLAYHLGQLRAGRHSYYRLDLARCALSLAAAGTTLHPGLRLGPCRQGLRRVTGGSARPPGLAA